MKTIYLVKKNSDTTEGRGPMVIDCAFTKENDAKTYIDDKPGVMGRKAKWSEEKYGDWQVEPLVVFETIEERNKWDKDAIKRAALAKLTPAERKVLGL